MVTAAESSMWERVHKDFADEVDCLEVAIASLLRYVVALVQAQPLLYRPNVDLTSELRNASNDVRSNTACAILMCEALERLTVARLLLLTGHQSRALSCARDAFQVLRWGHVCSRDSNQAERWVRGKSVKASPGFQYPPQLDEETYRRAQVF